MISRSPSTSICSRRVALSTLRTCSMPTTLSRPPSQTSRRVWCAVASVLRISSTSSFRSTCSICPRGVIVSSTVMSSSSKRLRKIDWCFLGMNLPPSSTRVRSSAMDSGCAAPSPTWRMRSTLRMPRTITFTIHIAGRVARISGVRTKEAPSAIRSE